MKLRICMYGFVRMYVSVNHINPPNIRTFLKKIKSFSLYQTGILYKKEYIVDSKRIMRKSALKYSEGMRA